MNITETDPLQDDEEMRLVLAAYETAQSVRKTIDPEHDGWVPRLRRIDGVDTEQTSAIHGKLIAYGYLKVRLGDRRQGVVYRVGSPGRQALAEARDEAVPTTE